MAEINLKDLPTSTKDLKPGLQIGYLLILKKSQAKKSSWRVKCLKCGKMLTVPSHYLARKTNPKTHCGCDNRSVKTWYNREYRIWTMMKTRCNNFNHVAYENYGGRGIKVCKQWMDPKTGFEQFLKDVGPAPDETYTIDRVDVDGDYEPIHKVTGKVQVKWSTPKEQAANKRPRKAKQNIVTHIK